MRTVLGDVDEKRCLELLGQNSWDAAIATMAFYNAESQIEMIAGDALE